MTKERDRSRIAAAIVWGGLVAGLLDLTFALLFNHSLGVPFIRVPQAIASGLLGRGAFGGGLTTAALGLALHFLIAFCLAAFYNGASRLFPVLIRWAVLCGPVYGLGIYLFMQRVVLPLSRAPEFKHTPLTTWSDLASHVFFVGLTIALFARHYAGMRAANRQPREPNETNSAR
jgi:uncharacterized membrane protein YagU involved in acid resistance